MRNAPRGTGGIAQQFNHSCGRSTHWQKRSGEAAQLPRGARMRALHYHRDAAFRGVRENAGTEKAAARAKREP